jgi:hypothetical protein
MNDQPDSLATGRRRSFRPSWISSHHREERLETAKIALMQNSRGSALAGDSRRGPALHPAAEEARIDHRSTDVVMTAGARYDGYLGDH